MRRWLFATTCVLYVAAFPYHPRLRSPNELCRLWQARALVDFHTLSLNQTLHRYGRVGDLSVYGGQFYPSKAPLLSLLAVPLYAALEAVHGGQGLAVPETQLVYLARLFLTVLPTLLMLRPLTRFLQAYAAPNIAEALGVTYAFGSLALSYSLLFMSHQTCAVLVFFALYALWRLARGEWPVQRYLWAGLFAGASVAAEYTAALAVAALALYGLFTAPRGERARGAALFTLGLLPFAALLMAYHQLCFGGPFESGYKHLADAGYQPWHLGGFLGIRVPDLRALGLSFFSPLRGFFTLAPFWLLGLWGLPRLYRRDRALFLLSAALVLGYAYFTSSFAYDSWGWTSGPRHLTPLGLFLLVPAALALDAWSRRGSLVGTRIGAALCMASVLTTGLLTGVNYIPDDVSNGVGALSLPLFAQGFWPPTLAALWTPVAWPGALWILGVLAMAGCVGGLLVPRLRSGLAARVAMPLMLGAQVVLLVATTRNDGADRNARRLLESAWLVRPGGPGAR